MEPFDGVQEALVRCDCRSLDHLLELTVFDRDKHNMAPEAFIQFHLGTWMNFWRRLRVAFKYVFGLRQRYGAWDELCLNKSEAIKFRDALDAYVKLFGDEK
jgi:hypothetical protein